MLYKVLILFIILVVKIILIIKHICNVDSCNDTFISNNNFSTIYTIMKLLASQKFAFEGKINNITIQLAKKVI